MSDASKAVDGADVSEAIVENGAYLDVEAANQLARNTNTVA